jgi:argininosuccinate lyase
MKNTPLWSGRFEEALHPAIFEFNQSITTDRALWRADCLATLAHARELARIGILPADALTSLEPTLRSWAEEEESSHFADNSWREFEDVHSLLEARLTAQHGELGKRVHTGRSRNDQVATAFRLTLRSRVDHLAEVLEGVRQGLLSLARKHPEDPLPGYTHLQRAQPILLAHWCLAYVEMFKRDAARLREARGRLNQLPLGSAALAGSPYPIDRFAVATELGFEGVCANSLDAVSDRDFCVELAHACSLIAVHLSRLSEDLILYCSSEFRFFKFSDRVSTGSSLMPQKKNPDVPELIRGKTGTIFGSLFSLLTLLKALPMAYNKDLQEDKETTFRCVSQTESCLEAMRLCLENLEFQPEVARKAAQTGYLNATDLADALVGLGTPFRVAHEQAAALVRLGLQEGRELHELSLEQIRAIAPQANASVFEKLTLESSLRSKKTYGSTHPDCVRTALEKEI